MSEPYEYFTATDPYELWAAIDDSAERFLSLAHGLDLNRSLSNSTWSGRDVVGHVLTVLRRYTQGATLGETPRDVDRINEQELAALGDVSAAALLDELAAEKKAVRDMFPSESVDLRMSVPFHGGATIDAAAALSNIVGEFEIHGRDLARCGDRPWRIKDRHSVLVLNGVLQILPAYARRTARGSLQMRIRVPGARPWLLDFSDGSLTSRPAAASERVDLVLRSRPEPLLLSLYSRIGPLSAMRSGMFVSGRRPWRLARLPQLIEKP